MRENRGNLKLKMAHDKECDVNNLTTQDIEEKESEKAQKETEISGWLLKRTKMSMQWKKKWFSLKERTLFYGDSPEDTPKSFVLDSCEIATCEIKSKSYTFYLKPKNSQRKYFLCAENDSDLQDWMQAVCLARCHGQKTSSGSETCVVQ